MGIRRLLEPEAAALAAQRIRRSEVTALRKIAARGTSLAGRESPDFDRLSALNRKFHLAILAACGNTAIERIVSGIFDLLLENTDLFVRRKEWALQSWSEGGDHAQIIAAIVSGDADTARKLMYDHLAYG